jgi:hypothetical protein
MEQHVDALGYLLVGVVFSVGLLSARIHANLDSTVQTVSNQSWGLRQAILEGGHLGPPDLAEVMGSVRRTRDYVAIGSRLLNWAIFATTLGIFVDALVLQSQGVETPHHKMVVLGLLFIAALVVVVFSEFDVHQVSVEQRAEVDASTLGRLQRLARAIERGEVDRAMTEVVHLRETFPEWGLLVELEAYLDLRAGRARNGLARIERLLASGGDVYISPVVGAACCLEAEGIDAEGLDAALVLLERIEQRGGVVPRLDQLNRALGVTAGHLPTLLDDPSSAPIDAQQGDDGRTGSRRTVQVLIGQALERRREPVHELALDLDPARVDQTASVIATLQLWETSREMSDFASNGVLPQLLHVVVGPDEASVPALLGPYAEQRRDPRALESFGLVALACGEPRVALEYLESAIRLSPAGARAHWGRAVACHRIGWQDAAQASLGRFEMLSEETPLLSVTRQRLSDKTVQATPAEIADSYLDGIDNMDRVELALLGIDLVPDPGTTVRERFAAKLAERALAGAAS